MAIEDDHFETMQARARSFRKRIAELGFVSGPVIERNVRERIRWRPTADKLPPAQRESAAQP